MTRGVGKVVFAALVALVMLVVAAPASAVGPCKGQNESIDASNIDQAERSLLCLVNSYRSENGLSVLAHDASLQRAARGHSEDMVRRSYFSHESPEGKNVRDRAIEQGYPSDSGFGENIGLHQAATPLNLFEAWRDSAGHNENMLHPDWVNAGMGFAVGTPPPYEGADGATGTQAFGTATTGADDTAANLFVTEACSTARAKRRRAARRVRRARRAVRRTDTATERKRARRRVRRSVRRLRRARTQARSACGSGSF